MANLKTSRRWTFDRNVKITDPSQSLAQCIAQSNLLVSFSISATNVSIRQYHPTILCIPEKMYVPDWHDYLSSIPLVKVARTSHMLDKALEDTHFRNYQKNDFLNSQWRYVDYAFGQLNTKNNLTKLIDKLAAEHQI